MPASVMMLDTSSGGVSSNAGFITLIPSGAVLTSPILTTS